MADEKSPKPRIALPEADPAPQVPGPEPAKADPAADAREAATSLRSWVSRTFPGRERSFWGGVCGLVLALVVFAIGVWNTLVIALFVVVGIACGQALDGDPKIINAVRRLFSGRNQ